MSRMSEVKSYLDSMNSLSVYPSLSFVHKRSMLPVDEICDGFINWATKQKKNPYFFKSYGISDDLCILYAKELYNYCDVCDRFFKPGYKSKCSELCYNTSRVRMRTRLSESRKKYNPRDPESYAKRHGIDIEDAKIIVDKMCVSHRQVSYWVDAGMEESDAIAKVSEIQSNNSKRCNTYWISRGFSEDDAAEEVRRYQRSNSSERRERRKDQFWILEEYWTNRGFSKEDARIQIDAKKKEMGAKIKETASKKSKLQKRIDHPLTLEFYLSRGFDEKHAITEIATKLAKRSGGKFVSMISQEFCDMLASNFKEDKMYYHNSTKEFSSWDYANSRIYFYDFVNTTKKFVVEFHGNYWHSVDDPKDLIKEKVMRDRGFSYFVVWESDFKTDKTKCINSLIDRIKNENNKN